MTEHSEDEAGESNEVSNFIEQLQFAQDLVHKIRTEINKALIGQQRVVDSVLTALIAGGHVLIEGVPGLGKTLLVKALAKSFAGDFNRIQFTPDLMPSDVTGHAIYHIATEKYDIRTGPVFTNLLLADEINRAPAKTQAALLEVMQEKQVTIEGKSFELSLPFMVLATQNPIEQEGTYPLPEAELDRFIMKIYIDYPEEEEEVEIVNAVTTGKVNDGLNVADVSPIVKATEVVQIQKLASQIPVDDQVCRYATKIVRATRDWSGILQGVGPRGSISLIRAARAFVLIRGGEFVTPDDIKEVALSVLRHRIIPAAELEIEGLKADNILQTLLGQVEAPRT